MMAVRFWRVIYGLTVLLLFAAMMATGCGGGTGSEFLGKWETIEKPKETIEIVRNGDQFLIIKEDNRKIGVVLKDGGLEVPGAFRVTYIERSDTLTLAGMEFKRKKEDAEKIKTVQKDTVKQECPSTQIAALQTLGTEDGKQMVLSLTLSDGSNVKYLIKLPLPQADRLQATAKEGAKEKVSSWELEGMGTALSIGDNPLPLGVALKLAK